MSDQLIQEHYFGYKTEGVALDIIVPKTPLEDLYLLMGLMYALKAKGPTEQPSPWYLMIETSHFGSQAS